MASSSDLRVTVPVRSQARRPAGSKITVVGRPFTLPNCFSVPSSSSTSG